MGDEGAGDCEGCDGAEDQREFRSSSLGHMAELPVMREFSAIRTPTSTVEVRCRPGGSDEARHRHSAIKSRLLLEGCDVDVFGRWWRGHGTAADADL